MAGLDFVQAEKLVDQGVGVGHHMAVVGRHVCAQAATLVVRYSLDHVFAIMGVEEKLATLGV